MADLRTTPARLAILDAAARNDLWQEDDHRTTNEYLHEHFGLSDPLRDVTEEADAAAVDGHITLVVSKHGARRWELTEAGALVLAAHDKETDHG